ncbi:MAG: hypothetical protein ACYTG5_17170 [Planctomycetota bacterium]|jgi:hypothetical protein
MRKQALGLALLLSVTLTSCFAGPHQLRRTVDDWDNKMYVENPWLDAALWVIPVIPFATLGATFVDTLVGDAYAFWFKDAFSGENGTGYKHHDVGATRNMHSLLDDGKFMEITGG